VDLEMPAGSALGERVAERARVFVDARRVIYAVTGVYAAVFAAASALQFRSFGYARFDLGNMVQAVWSTAHGRFLETTTIDGTQMSRLGAHADPFLALLAPFWLVWPSPLLLLVLQALAVSAGSFPVFWLARKHLGSDRVAANFAGAYLLYPATQFNAFTPSAGFHSVSIAVPLILLAIWFLDEERLIPFAVTGLVAASTKEEIGIAVGLLGIWYAMRKGKRLQGAAILACGTAITALDFLVVIPHFSPPGLHPFADRYAAVGGSVGGILHTAASDPAALVRVAATGDNVVYLLLLLVPFLGLWLFEPLVALAAVPDLAINLLSSKPEQTTVQFQYTAGILPFIVAAAILGAARLRRNPRRLSLFVLAACACLALQSPIRIAKTNIHSAIRASPARVSKQRAMALIPAAAPVATSNQLGAELSERRYVYIFPYVRNARWIILDKKDRYLDDSASAMRAFNRAIARYTSSPNWHVIYSSDGVEVLRKGRSGP
jgi:uncharacterized membrane protein